jgi:hypothetical protein
MVTKPSFYNLKDQGIYAAGDFFIPQERYRAAPYNVNQPTNNPDEVPAGIPTVYQPQGDGRSDSYTTSSVNDLMKNYTLDTRKQYFGSQPTPLVDNLYQSKLDKTFMGFPSYREQQLTGPDMGEYIGSGTDVPLELTGAGKVQNTLGNIKDTASGIMSKVGGIGPVSMLLGSMDKFDTLSPADQEFIKQNMGYRGPTVFGENSSGLSKDIFGINTRSAFGNYADYVGKEATSLGEALSKSAGRRGLSFDASKGSLVDSAGNVIDEDDYDAAMKDFINKTKMMRNKFSFYTQKEKERVANEKLMEKQAAVAAEKAYQERVSREAQTADRARAQNQSVYESADRQGFTNRDGGFSTSRADRAGTSEGSGQFSSKSGRGRTGYLSGGLADMLEIYD